MEGTAVKRFYPNLFLLFLSFLFAAFPASGWNGKEAFHKWKKCGNTLRLDFNNARETVKGLRGWIFQGKPFTAHTKFTLIKDGPGKVLKVESRKGSGAILLDISKLPLEEYPILRWKWKAEELPKGGDGRIPRKDDQALGIYIGAGRNRTTSLAFRWETMTPAGYKGKARYGMGLVSVDWESLRSRKDPLNEWIVEEVDLYGKLFKLFKGKIPKKDLALSISGNSQYTKSASCGYIAYFELAPRPSAVPEKQN